MTVNNNQNERYIIYKIGTETPYLCNFDVDVVFLVEYGFGDPTLIDNSIVIYKKNFTRNNIKYYSRNCGIYKNKFIHHKSLYS